MRDNYTESSEFWDVMEKRRVVMIRENAAE
jgi:hypothetical protein